MKSYSQILSLLLIFAFAAGATQLAVAQDDPRSQAVTLYNNAQELASDNQYLDAVEMYREAMAIARENDLEDIVELTSEQIPRVYQRRAAAAYREYQNNRTGENASRALEYFKEQQEVGEEFGSTQVAQQAQGAIPQLYYIRSVHEFRDEDYEAAMASLDTAIELNPNYATAHYQKGIVFKTMYPDNIEEALTHYDRAIEIAQQTGDNRTLDNARRGAAEELVYRAVTLAEQREFRRAIDFLNRVENYNPETVDAHYRLAEIYNERGNWESAIEHANIALERETGGVVDRAKIYFELGTAYKGLGDEENACSAFENANYGDFSEPASHELQFELRCPGHSPTGR